MTKHERELRDKYRVKVQAGVKWLDAEYPKWRQRIEVETLDMENPCKCVIGQVAGEYYDALLTADLDPDVDGVELGFLCEPEWHREDSDSAMDVLRDLWVEELQKDKADD